MFFQFILNEQKVEVVGRVVFRVRLHQQMLPSLWLLGGIWILCFAHPCFEILV